ncbi:hypothetical protein Rhe02_19910 [Rhizocola hellebori]|uniref:YggT family protein n=1 Tax=Rhizocola hellebori TaxID=1392758 RepID=A0A8J3VDV8_9ACTN|nr:YggT family protein [Rhizocola hellebori]GIH03924.1 hypothetical protein Rhe02_19910 [Rhizocola hellebori]
MTLVLTMIATLLLVFQLLLIARAVLDWAAALSRPPRPKSVRGRLSAVVEKLTEPVLAPVRRLLPPLRLGAVALDMSFVVVFFVVLLLRRWVLSM